MPRLTRRWGSTAVLTAAVAVVMTVTVSAMCLIYIRVASPVSLPQVRADMPAAARAGEPFPVPVRLPEGIGGEVSLLVLNSGAWKTLDRATLPPGGATVLTGTLEGTSTLRVQLSGPVDWQGEERRVLVASAEDAAPRSLPVDVQASPAVGSGANPEVSRISKALWSQMEGVTWQPGCPVGRRKLRLLEVNFWGVDGQRHRGRIVVHRSVAGQVAEVFRDLYRLRYPIRQMRLPEEFGQHPLRGADDLRSMSQDNTSAFNCRFVVGREKEQALSPHAYGIAVDVNPLVNPFVSRVGVVPDPAWLNAKEGEDAAVIRSSSHPVVRAFMRHGASWGGSWDQPDYQHFEWPVP